MELLPFLLLFQTLKNLFLQESICGACETERAALMIQLFGQPYHQNTLKPTIPSEQACMSRVS